MLPGCCDPGHKANGNALDQPSGGGRGGYTFGRLMKTCHDAGTGCPAGRHPTRGRGLGARPDHSPAIRASWRRWWAGDGNNAAAGAGIGGGLVFLVTDSVEGTAALGQRWRWRADQGGHDRQTTHRVVAAVAASSSRRPCDERAHLPSMPTAARAVQFITLTMSEGPRRGGGGGVIAMFVPGATQPTMNVNGGLGTSDSTAVTSSRSTAHQRRYRQHLPVHAGQRRRAACRLRTVGSGRHRRGRIPRGRSVPATPSSLWSPSTTAATAGIGRRGVIDTITAGLGPINWSCTAAGGAVVQRYRRRQHSVDQ